MTKMQTLSRILVLPVVLIVSQQCAAQTVPFFAFGSDSAYSPATAEYSGDGFGNVMGHLTFSGLAIPTPTNNPLILNWESLGHQMSDANGDQIFMEGGGKVRLIPLNDKGLHTAIWFGRFEVTGGTGAYEDIRPARRPLTVIAVNHPFDINNDPVWFFDWIIKGKVRLR